MIVPVLVLLVAAANAANLLLARGVDRRKELALRRALGASRARLIRQLLIECLHADAGRGRGGRRPRADPDRGHRPRRPDSGRHPPGFQIDVTVLGATLRPERDHRSALRSRAGFRREQSRRWRRRSRRKASRSRSGRRRHRLRDVLVVGQVAVSVVLLVIAGLFLRSLTKALRVDPGFEARDGATLSFDLALQGYSPARQRDVHPQRARSHARRRATIESAALTTALPLGGRMFGTEIVAARAPSPTMIGVSTFVASISPSYFDTMRIPLTRGRDFTASDTRSAPGVVIVNDVIARRLWPSSDPIGQRLRVVGVDEGWREVVGVARTTRYDDLTESPASYIYLPLEQSPPASLSLVARARPGTGSAIPALEGVVRSLDPQLPLVDVRTFEQVIARSVGKQRAASALLAALGGLALLLAALGHLWRHVARHDAAREGDRDPHGPWRARAGRPAAVRPRVAQAVPHRRGHRRRCWRW